MNCSALHCTALKHSELLCTTLYRTALHCTSYCTLPFFISLHYTSLQCSTLDYDLYFLLQAFRHNTGKVMDKQAIFMFGFITIAVFVQIKGNSFHGTFFFLSQSYFYLITKLNNGSVSSTENVSHSELFAKGKHIFCFLGSAGRKKICAHCSRFCPKRSTQVFLRTKTLFFFPLIMKKTGRGRMIYNYGQFSFSFRGA